MRLRREERPRQIAVAPVALDGLAVRLGIIPPAEAVRPPLLVHLAQTCTRPAMSAMPMRARVAPVAPARRAGRAVAAASAAAARITAPSSIACGGRERWTMEEPDRIGARSSDAASLPC